jgi:hypothetical protein
MRRGATAATPARIRPSCTATARGSRAYGAAVEPLIRTEASRVLRRIDAVCLVEVVRHAAEKVAE